MHFDVEDSLICENSVAHCVEGFDGVIAWDYLFEGFCVSLPYVDSAEDFCNRINLKLVHSKLI